MFALRERRQHVTQEDFEMAVSKVMKSFRVIQYVFFWPALADHVTGEIDWLRKDSDKNMSLMQLMR